MFSSQERAGLSQHDVHHTGSLLGMSDSNTEMSITIHLKPAAIEQYQAELNALFYKTPSDRAYLSSESLQQYFVADEKGVKTLVNYLQSFGLQIQSVDIYKRLIVCNGNLDLFQRVFGIGFNDYKNELNHVYRVQDGEPNVPIELSNYISYIEGLHSIPLQRSKASGTAQASNSDTSTDAFLGYTPIELAEAYEFPEGDGDGETIGIIELGGTYIQSDMDKYFSDLGIETPTVYKVGVDANDIIQNDLEVTLDIQVIGALLPKASLVLFYGNTLITAIKEAIYNPKFKPSVLSVSWAGSEFNYSRAELTEMNQLCYQAALLGITIVAASGDQGAFNSKNFLNVNVPASMPFVLACGGTKINIQDGQNKEEIVWNELATKQGATGGGYSARFAIPSYQHQALEHYHMYQGNSMGVPDVAANADASSGYKTLYKGRYFAEGGTSAATPVWASLLVRINQHLGYRLGHINEILYKQANTDVFRQITEGNNGHYPAASYWNPSTGLGSPKGKALLQSFNSLKS